MSVFVKILYLDDVTVTLPSLKTNLDLGKSQTGMLSKYNLFALRMSVVYWNPLMTNIIQPNMGW